MCLRFFLLLMLFLWACNEPVDDSPAGEVLWSIERPKLGQADTAPLILGSNVYVAVDGFIRCYEAETGSLLWSSPQLIQTETFNAAVILHDEKNLYINRGRFVFAVRRADGGLVWKQEIPSFSASTFVTMVAGEDHLFYAGNGEFVRLNKLHGAIELRVPVIQNQPDDIIQQLKTPVLSDDNVLYIPANFFERSFGEIQGNVHAFDAETGQHLWSFNAENKRISTPGSENPRLLAAGVFAVSLWENRVIATATSIVYMLDRRTGEIIWEQFHDDDAFETSVVVTDGKGYIGSIGETMYAIDLISGHELWKAHAPGSMFSDAVVNNGHVYLANTGSGEIWVWNADSGAVIWRGFPPEHAMDNFSTYLSPVGVSDKYLGNVGGKKIYLLKNPI